MLSYRVSSIIKLVVPRPQIDGPQLFALLQADQRGLARFLPWVPAVSAVTDEVNFLRQTNRHLGNQESLNLVIQVNDQVAGMISFNRFDTVNRSADIGYWLGATFRGKGVMTQAVAGLCTLGFTDYNLQRIELRAAVDNAASNAVARRAGFHLEGSLRQRERLLDGYHDENLYSYLRRDWLTTQK